MELPRYKDLNKSVPIDIKTRKGVVKLYVESLKRGLGSKKWWLTVEGFCRESVAEREQCHVIFGGAEAGGTFSMVNERNGLWIVTFEAMISDPIFWGEA